MSRPNTHSVSGRGQNSPYGTPSVEPPYANNTFEMNEPSLHGHGGITDVQDLFGQQAPVQGSWPQAVAPGVGPGGEMSPGSSCDENVQYLGVQTDDAALVETHSNGYRSSSFSTNVSSSFDGSVSGLLWDASNSNGSGSHASSYPVSKATYHSSPETDSKKMPPPTNPTHGFINPAATHIKPLPPAIGQPRYQMQISPLPSFTAEKTYTGKWKKMLHIPPAEPARMVRLRTINIAADHENPEQRLWDNTKYMPDVSQYFTDGRTWSMRQLFYLKSTEPCPKEKDWQHWLACMTHNEREPINTFNKDPHRKLHGHIIVCKIQNMKYKDANRENRYSTFDFVDMPELGRGIDREVKQVVELATMNYHEPQCPPWDASP